MPVQTRAKVPVDRVYWSPAARGQVKFTSRRRNVTPRHSLGVTRRSRQQTLTQIDFVDIHETAHDDNEEDRICNDGNYTRQSKRRRRDGNVSSSPSKFHTQTLTQLDFVSTPGLMLENQDGLENYFQGGSLAFKRENSVSLVHNTGLPKTPNRRRVYEVPSSQSPLSPASTRSRRSFPVRSPLKTLDANCRRQSLSPLRRQENEVLGKLKMEIQDTFEEDIASQQSLVPQTPRMDSGIENGLQSATLPPPIAGMPRHFKDEIQDSDEEDGNLDTYYDDHAQESQIYHKNFELSPSIDNRFSNPTLNHSQGADEKLQSTILQFAEQISSISELEMYTRPSQATTVSLSQPPSSSPFLQRSKYKTQAGEVMLTEDEGRRVFAVPDSLSFPNIAASPSLSLASSRVQQSETCQSLGTLANHPSTRRIQKSEDYGENASLPLMPLLLLPSSQLLTRSQMLPESLMNDSLPVPPVLIEDSDEDLDHE